MALCRHESGRCCSFLPYLGFLKLYLLQTLGEDFVYALSYKFPLNHVSFVTYITGNLFSVQCTLHFHHRHEPKGIYEVTKTFMVGLVIAFKNL